MNDHLLKPSELKFLLQNNGIKNYKWKGFLSGGSFPKLLLENNTNNEEVIGKIVSSPLEGELEIWPKLQHRNLNRLLEILVVDDNVKILISPAVEKCIGNLIHDNSFIQHPLCFDRKKSYARDILLGLNYMHKNSVFLLNLSDTNVAVCACTDKAVICDFSYTFAGKKVTKKSLPSHPNYEPPEVQNASGSEVFDSLPIDMWDCGILFLQIFTQHLLPWRGVVNDSLEFLDIDVLKKANIGACFQNKVITDLKILLQKLLSDNPNYRLTAEEAFHSNFLQSLCNRLDERARRFWNNGGTSNTFDESGSFTNSDSNSDLDVWTVSETNTTANLHHDDISCPKAGNVHLVRTQSEPATAYQEVPNPSLHFHTSFPSLSINSSSDHSLTYYEESILAKNNPLGFRTTMVHNDMPNDANCECNQNFDEIRNMINQQYQRSPYDIFLNEWIADISANAEDDSLSCSYPELKSKVDDQLSKSSFANSLEQMLPRIISMTGLSLDLASPSPKSRESYRSSEPNIQKNRLDNKNDDFMFKIKRRKSFSSPTDMDLSNKARVDTKLVSTSTPDENICVEVSKISSLNNVNFSGLNQTENVDSAPLSALKTSKDIEIVPVHRNQIYSEGNKTQNRRKWYHRLCLGCKSKRKK